MTTTARREGLRLPPGPLLLGLAVFGLAFASLTFTAGNTHIAALWPANAVVIAVLLRTSRRRWPSLVAAGLAGNVAASLAVHGSPPLGVALSLCNTLEILIFATGMRHFTGRAVDLSRQRGVIAFVLVGVAAALAAGLMAAMILTTSGRGAFLTNLTGWLRPDGLGLMVLTPALLILTPTTLARLVRRDRLPRTLTLTAILGLALLLVFSEDRYSLLFLMIPVLLLVTFQLGLAGAAVGLLATSLVAMVCTLYGLGPARLLDMPLPNRLGAIEVFLMITTISVLSVAAVLADRRRLEKTLRGSIAEADAARQAASESEARYRLLADSASDVILKTDLTGAIQYVSPAALRYGYTLENLLGEIGDSLAHEDDRERLQQVLIDIATGAADLDQGLQFRLLTATGDTVWMEGNPTLMRDADGAPVGILTMLRDITARKALEGEVALALAAAEAAAAVKSEFLSNMSHELRTPLTSIIGFSDLLRGMNDLPGEAPRYARRIAAASAGLLTLVNDVLDFSKLEAGRVELAPKVFDPKILAQETLELFEPQADAKGLRLGLVASGLPAAVMADPGRLRQILLNLVGNALKFTVVGAVMLKVAHADDHLVVEVVDTGPGIPSDRLDRVFQRFSQVDGSITRTHGGTGLGLAICQGLVEAMGGEIGVESVLGEGSTFRFQIAAPASQASVLAGETGLGLQPIDGLRVLVVDDNAANRELARAILETQGVEVSEAADGLAAVEAAEGLPFDVILMDIRMPGLDGPGAAARIRQGEGPNQDAPILAFSADGDLAHLQELSRQGFNALVRKPIRPLDLIGAVARAAFGGDEQSEESHVSNG